MQHDPVARNVLMANQIARNFAALGEERAVMNIARHIRLFWDPRMRATIFAHVEKGGEGLDPMALKALQTLAVKAKDAVSRQEPV